MTKKLAVVTGASRGLGRGIVEALAARGVRVNAVARGEAALAAVATAVPNVTAVVGDAADATLAARLLAQQPDLVVLCAGAAPVLGSIHEQTWESFQTNWNVDTKSAFVWLKEALRLPLERGAHVIVVSSGAAVQGSPVSGGYAPAKRAQWLLADYAANESKRGDVGVRIHCLLPHLNASTELGRAGIAAYAARAGLSVAEFGKRFEPSLTPAIMGAGVVEMFEAPEKFEQLAWRITGTGLAAFA